MTASALFFLSIVPGASAQPSEAAPVMEPNTPAPPRCENPESRQFDFWIGEWNVVDRSTGAFAGVSHVERLYGGCVLRENWSSPGFRGGSLNGWSAAERRWHQSWMDQSGAIRHFVGGLEDGRMVLTAQVPDSADPSWTMLVRMTFTPSPDGSVRQYSDLSRDGGESWEPRYDFLYRRMD